MSIMEIQVFFVKLIPNTLRNEPQNIGLIVYTANEDFEYRLLKPVKNGGDVSLIQRIKDVKLSNEHFEYLSDIESTLKKYGRSCLKWINKQTYTDDKTKIFVEFAYAKMEQNYNFELMFCDLVM